MNELQRFGEESNCSLCFIFALDAQVSKLNLQVRQESMLSADHLFRGRRRTEMTEEKYLQTTTVIKIKLLSTATPPPSQICLGRR